MALVLLLVGSARADLGIAVAAKAGTLGAGVEVSKSLFGDFGVRASLNKFTYSLSDSVKGKDLKYDADLNLSSWSVILDYYPWSGVFRVCGGIIHNGNNFVAKMQSSKSYSVGGRTYTPDDQGELDATIDWKPMAPYFGIGWGNSTEKDKFFGVNVDFGAMIQNAPKVKLEGTKMMAAMETEAPKIENHLSSAKTWFVASIGFSFHF